MVDYFKTLFTPEYSNNGFFNSHGKFPLLTQGDIECLLLRASDDEIQRALFSMAHPKAPGPDGFQANFYQSNWDILGNSVCSMVRNIMCEDSLDTMLNRTLIVFYRKFKDQREFLSLSQAVCVLWHTRSSQKQLLIN